MTAGAVYQERVIDLADEGVDLADMNGDRLSDVVQVTPTAVICAYSLGRGRFAAGLALPIPDTILSDGADSQIARAKLTDINCDGLADLVIERALPGELWFWLNLGRNAFSERYTVTGLPPAFGSNPAVRWADINGNGSTDLIYADSAAAEKIQALDLCELICNGVHPHLLTAIDNGLGRFTSITYQSSTAQALAAAAAGQPWSTTVPFPVPVVARVEVNSGVDLDLQPGVDIYEKSFVYRDGFYDDLERQFRGFAEVTVTEPGDETIPASVTVSRFFTGGPDGVSNDEDEDIDELSDDNHREEEALKGLVKALEKRDGNGKLYSREENDWQIRTLPLANPADREIRLALNPASRSLIYEGGETPKTISSSRAYDDFGNVILLVENGDLDLAGDERRTYTDYINNQSDWLIGLPYYQLLTDAAVHPCRINYTYYDGVKFVGLPAGQATAGHISRQSSWVKDDEWIDTIRSEYDLYGNLISALGPRGAARSIEWDSQLHIFPIRETIEVAADQPDLEIMAAYNLGLGVMTESHDFNGHQTSYHYDIFSRPTAVVRPGDSEALPTLSYRYQLCDPRLGRLYSYDAAGQLSETATSRQFSRIASFAREVSGASGTIDSVQLVDGMGRKIAALSEAESGGIVSEMAIFNARGLARYSFLPFPLADLNTEPAPDLNLSYSQISYDGLGRALQTTTPPDENAIRDVSSISYQPLSVTTTDARGHLKTAISDGLERQIATEEHNAAEVYITRYAYDAASNLLSVTDHHNNVKSMIYDGLGRRVLLADPDRGRMAYEYDAASNLIRTLDNKDQEIVYEYDLANRLIAKDYLDAAGLSPDISYLYDRPAADYPAAANLAGHLASVNDLSGAVFYSYDERGNNDWYVVRIEDGGQSADFPFTSEFDVIGRVTAKIFPDGDRLTYSYNHRGLLSEIPGFAEITAYHPGGGIENITFANQITTSNQYDDRYRLLATSTTPAAAAVLRDLHYRFDPTNNISAIDDLRPITPELPEFAGQSFLYDDLNRLTQAQGPGYGRIDFAYDAIGNMTSKSSPETGDQHIDDPLINLKAMTYGGIPGTSNRGERQPGDDPGPHALTATESGLVYAYDDNGNVIARDGKTFTWDFDDRLLSTVSDDSATSYVYNAAGQRVIKKVARDDTIDTTWYVDDAYEIRNGRAEKYVFADGRRIARVAGRLAAVGDEIKQLLILEPGYNFVGVEVETAAAIAVALGEGAEIWTLDDVGQDYLGYIPAESRYNFTTLVPGRGYLVKAPQAKTITLTGLRSLPQFELSAGWNLVAAFSDHSLSMTEVQAATGYRLQALWYYDTQSGSWHSFAPGRAPFLNDLETMAPGRAYWLQLSETFDLEATAQTPVKQFYHPDHLGSAGLVTDNSGTVIERVEYYPYGRPRYESRVNFDSPYKYTDKELDRETGLMYYEARYYDPVVGRFMSVDPSDKYSGIIMESYLYSNNNPIVYVDIDGLKGVSARSARRSSRRNRRSRNLTPSQLRNEQMNARRNKIEREQRELEQARANSQAQIEAFQRLANTATNSSATPGDPYEAASAALEQIVLTYGETNSDDPFRATDIMPIVKDPEASETLRSLIADLPVGETATYTFYFIPKQKTLFKQQEYTFAGTQQSYPFYDKSSESMNPEKTLKIYMTFNGTKMINLGYVSDTENQRQQSLPVDYRARLIRAEYLDQSHQSSGMGERE